MENSKEIKKEVINVIAQDMTKEGIKELVIREGKALELREPVPVLLNGTISAPLEWLEKKQGIDLNEAYILVNRSLRTITLCIDQNSAYKTVITGELQVSNELKEMGINSGEYITHLQMAEKFKMNRSYFENRTEAMQLVSDLRNFRAKVDKEIERNESTRGDKRLLISQAVEHNLPNMFNLFIPVFSGEEREPITVEVYVNPDDFTCTLVSAEVRDMMADRQDWLINNILNKIKEVTENRIAIIEK